jgi:hypothetical protein
MKAPLLAAEIVAEDELFESIIADMDLLVSFAASARESARRRNSSFIRLHLMDIRATLLESIKTLKMLEAGELDTDRVQAERAA